MDSPGSRIPAYVRDGITRQDLDTLRAIRQLVEELIEERECLDEESVDELPDGADVETLQGGGSTTVVKEVPCGKSNCSTCPYGPYRYEFSWNGESLDWDYRGKADAEEGAV